MRQEFDAVKGLTLPWLNEHGLTDGTTVTIEHTLQARFEFVG